MVLRSLILRSVPAGEIPGISSMSIRAARLRSLLLLAVPWICFIAHPGFAAQDGGATTSPPSHRVPWTTSAITGRPEPPPPYQAEPVFPGLTFESTSLLVHEPTLNRFFVGEVGGALHVLPVEGAGGVPTVFFNAKESVARLNRGREKDDQLEVEGLYGLAFDPDFARNRWCYVCYVVRRPGAGKDQLPEGSRVVRLRVPETEPPACDPESEELVISWLQGGHNGGCLRFGPDGCLFISTGDGSAAFPPDERKSGQDLSTLLAKILRIDVHGCESGRAYAIPPDNPFVGNPDARGETWAYGLRNPWRMSFDRVTGDMWVGDVGWELWELVHHVRRGGNYGWSIVEGSQPVHTGWPRGPTPLVPPALEIPHTEGASVTGGYVYRGTALPELVGQYVFGDWETRRIWAAPVVPGGGLGTMKELVLPTIRIVDFAEDAAGELYLLDHDVGSIYRLTRTTFTAAARPFPRTLSETGLFASTERHEPAAGVFPFAVNAEQWSDHAVGERFVAVPDRGAIRIRPRLTSVKGSQFKRSMDFPTDTVLAKTLALDMVVGDPRSRRRIETQILHYDGREWLGYTYEWNDEQTDALLVDRGGKERILEVEDERAPGGRRMQTWRFAGRAECLRCHNPWSGHALAFSLPQLNRPCAADTTLNQLDVLRRIGLLENDTTPDRHDPFAEVNVPTDAALVPRLSPPFDPSCDIDDRARAYLHVNCSHCHRFNGGGSAQLYLTHDLALRDTLAVGGPPTQGSFGIEGARLIAPGDPYRSILFYRMSKTGPGHMPQIGAREPDDQGLELIREWIRQIPAAFADELLVEKLIELDEDLVHESDRARRPTLEWRAGRKLAKTAGRLEPNDDDRVEASRLVDARFAEEATKRIGERQALLTELLSSPARALLLVDALRRDRLPSDTRRLVLEVATSESLDPTLRDAFEVFLPDSLRTRRLGISFDRGTLLALAGDAERGRQLFHESTVVQCRICHRVGGAGVGVGPDLDGIGRKYDRAALLQHIVQPSLRIDPEYVSWTVQTAAGTVFTGLVVERTDEAVVVRDIQNQRHRIATAEIEEIHPLKTSLMPEMLLQDYAPQQAADLLEYLGTLRAESAPAGESFP